MKKFYLPLIAFIIFSTNVWAQSNTEVNKCGITLANEDAEKRFPGITDRTFQNTLEFNKFVEQFKAQKGEDEAIYTIPVVFHVIYNDDESNVSNAVIYEELQIINEDFNGLNPDFGNVIPEFDGVKSDVQIEFKLAQYDPEGNCTSGITRTFSQLTEDANDNVKSLISWPHNKYMNIWLVKNIDLGGGGGGIILGYAYFPSSFSGAGALPAFLDGIVCRNDNIGNNTSFGGRTITHEIGHWINLRHPWGNGQIETDCGTDFVSDTPTTKGQPFGCDLDAITCGSLDNVQNYMNYADCPVMFTDGQSDRMHAALNSSTAQRNQLWTVSNLENTGVLEELFLCAADFNASKLIQVCPGDNVDFFDQSYNGEMTTWQWTFEGGNPSTSIEKNPVVTYGEGGIYSVSLTVGNGTDEATATKTDYIHVLNVGPSTPYNETFDSYSSLPNEDWFIESGNSIKWDITTDASAVGNNSVYLKNRIQNDGEVDDLISSTVDLSSLADSDAAEITFKYAFAKKNDNDIDKMLIRFTLNCGGSWETRGTIKASNGSMVTAPNQTSNFIPDSDEWGEKSINIGSTYLIDNFRYKFEFTNGGGNNIYIDDIKIFDPTTVGINEINKTALNYSVYPNPVNNQLNVEFNLLEKTTILGELYDVAGRKVKTLFNNDYSLGTHRLDFNTSDLKAGLYFVKITLEGESFTKRVIKN
jgi:PKD repeat protein